MSPTDAARRGIGVLGGTFDPIHFGHLHAADDVRRALGLAEVRLIPAGDPPHRAVPAAPGADRLAMARLAAEAFPGLVADDREVARAGRSYTVDTLRELRGEVGERPLLLVVGLDAFRWLHTWHEWTRLFDLAHVVVVHRPGEPAEPELVPALAEEWRRRVTADPHRLESAPAGAIYQQPIAAHPISSTAIRAALAEGPAAIARVRGLLPDSVLAYIDRHRLYRGR